MHPISKRPLPVTVISCLFLVAGVIGIAYHATEFKTHGPFQYDLILVCVVRLVAVICAVFMLRASNWARWLLIIWLAYHVILSAFHSTSELIIHSLLLAVIAYFLFRPAASAYFRGARMEPTQAPIDSTMR
jgi:hypothetical protein